MTVSITGDVISPCEAEALGDFVDTTDVNDDGSCKLLPYSAIDPCACPSERELKYLLNQVRSRALQIVERTTRRHQLYAAATTLRLRRGPLRIEPDPADWWTEYKVVVPLVEAEVEVEGHGHRRPVGAASLVVAAGGDTWTLAPTTQETWLSVTISVTDQLDRCEL